MAMRHEQRMMTVLIIDVLIAVIWLGSRSANAAERYVISTLQSRVQFQAYSLLVNPVGTFQIASGEVVTDVTHPSRSHVRLTIDAASVDTANTRRDKHLRTEDFLFVEQHPTMTFASTAIRQDGNRYVVSGDLQIRGVTKPITFPVTVEQRHKEIVVRGRVRLNRHDFGLTYNAFFNPLRRAVDVMFTVVGVQP